MAQQSERLAAVLEPVVRDLGLELYDVEIGGSNRARTLRVLIDREGGVDLEAITSATEALAPVLDENPDVAAALPGLVPPRGVESRSRATAAHAGALPPRDRHHRLGEVEERRRRRRTSPRGRSPSPTTTASRSRSTARASASSTHDIVASHTVFEWGPAPKPGKSANAKKNHARHEDRGRRKSRPGRRATK